MSLDGRTIAITAERRSEEQAKLFRKRGATVVHAPTMHTVDLSDDDTLRTLTEAVIVEPPAWTIATTGFGMRLWFETADRWGLGDDLVAAIATSQVVARGLKARSACRQRGLEVAWSAPRESMPEVVDWLRGRPGIGEESLLVQLFDTDDHPSTTELVAVAGTVTDVPIYRWQRPLDTAPAATLSHDIAGGRVDAVTFTSQPAVRYLVEIADDEGVRDEMISAFNDGTVLPVCVGPVCAEAGVEAGITTMIWPEPFRLVPMVELAAQRLAGRAVPSG